MKLAIISDTHFGDPKCALIRHGMDDLGPLYGRFRDAAGTENDFLVMLGDIFDFSIAPYDEAYRSARAFFLAVKRDRIAKNIIYVPGNHDFDMWHTVQQQIRIIYQLRQGRAAKDFQWSVPGLIDDREGSQHRGFQLPGIIGPVDVDRPPSTEKLFLNGITKGDGSDAGETNFYVAYPNLYMVTKQGMSVLMTHGHYFEAFWTLSGELIKKVAKLDDADRLEDLVALNMPLSQLACSGVGQAGRLMPIARSVQRQVKDMNFLDTDNSGKPDIDEYIDRFRKFVDDSVKFESWLKEFASDLCLFGLMTGVRRALTDKKDTRFKEDFLESEDQEEKQRLRAFYDAACVEIGELNDDASLGDLDIREPTKMIYGHTHWPFSWGPNSARKFDIGRAWLLESSNTGGWLFKKGPHGTDQFCGAEVFRYQTGSEFSSVRIDWPG